MDKHHIDQFKKTLQEEQGRLTAELSSIAKRDPRNQDNWIANFPQMETDENGSHASRDEEEDEVEEYEVALAAEHSLESQLLRVTQALHRIDQGTYGICPTCKKEIPLERLSANPSAQYDKAHEPDVII